RGAGRRPVVVGPVGLGIVRIAAELENIVLRETQMLDELPRRVRQPRRPAPPQLRWQSRHRLVEADMRLLPVERLREVRTERGVLIHGQSPRNILSASGRVVLFGGRAET